MANIANAYNEALKQRQLYDHYAGIRNDYLNSYQQPMRGGMYGAMNGDGWWDDFMDGFNMVMKPVGDVAKTVAPFLPLIGLGECKCNGDCECKGDGYSGGTRAGYNDDGSRIRYEDPLDRNEYICSLPYSDKCNGRILTKKALKYSVDRDEVPSGRKLIKGSGMSGGDEISDTDMMEMKNIGLPQRYAQYFLGGRHPSSVPARERRMLIGKAMADAKLQDELRMLMKARKGAGMSGGDFDWSSLLSFAPLLLGLGEHDGDEVYADMMGEGFWDDVGDFFKELPSKIEEGVSKAFDFTKSGIEKVGQLAEAGKPLIDAYTALSGTKKGDKKDGGAMTYEQNMNMADAMGDIFSGMGYSGGADEENRPRVPSKNPLNLDAPVGMPNKKPLLGSNSAVQIYKGGDSCVNAPYVCDDTRIPINLQNRPTKEYLAMTGNGMSGGDWWDDFTSGLSSVLGPIGDVAKVVAPFLGEGQSGGADDCPTRAIGSGVSGGRKQSSWIQHVKAYAKQHNMKYNEALKKAGATYRK